MKSNSEPVTFSGDEKVPLNDCYIFRDNLAHRADVGISSGISYTEHPNLLLINVQVKGSKKNTFALGIPIAEAMKLCRNTEIWNESLYEYDACKFDLVGEIFDEHVADIVSAPWNKEHVHIIQEIEANDEVTKMVKQDLLEIAAASLETQDV